MRSPFPVSNFNKKYTWTFTVTLKPTQKPIFYSSTTHKIIVTMKSGDDSVIELTLDKAELPNRDFVFVYTL